MLPDEFMSIGYADAMAEKYRWAETQCRQMKDQVALLPGKSPAMGIAGLEGMRRDYEEETAFWSLRWYVLDFLGRAS